jgi:hypothetical protein
VELLTKAIEAKLPKLYATEKTPTNEKIAVLKLFDPCGRYTFFAVEGQREEGDFTLFGYCVSPLGPDCDEWGYTSLEELKGIRGPFGLGIERDLHFQPTKIGEILSGLNC